MARMSATVQVVSNMTKDDLMEELERVQVPGDATFRVNHHAADSRDPREVSSTDLVWTWTV